MGIRRTELAFEGQYTQIPNEWVRDDRLTRKARGLLVELMSHRIGWNITIDSLIDRGSEGRDSIRKAIAELERHGYLRRVRARREDGTLAGSDYEICDPGAKTPTSDYPTLAEPTLVNPPTKKTIPQEEHIQEDKPPISPKGDAVGEAFLMIWDLWPVSRRGTTKKSGSAFRTALTSLGGVGALQLIVDAIRRDVEVWSSWPGSDLQYVPLLSTWLNQGRWESQAAAVPRVEQKSFVEKREERQIALLRELEAEEQQQLLVVAESRQMREIEHA